MSMFKGMFHCTWWCHQMETFSALPFARGILRSPVNSPQKGQWRGALMFSLICARTNSWANNGDADDWRRHRAHYEVIVMTWRAHNRTLLIESHFRMIYARNSLTAPHHRCRNVISFLTHVLFQILDDGLTFCEFTASQNFICRSSQV